jgi:hypothetical protein
MVAVTFEVRRPIRRFGGVESVTDSLPLGVPEKHVHGNLL